MSALVNIQGPDGIQRPDKGIPEFHMVRGRRDVLFAVNGSRLYLLEDERQREAIQQQVFTSNRPVAEAAAEPAALSLNIAQSCNLACSYCYADEGRFGGAAQLMSIETAREAIRRHIGNTSSRAVSVGFIGGEPLLNPEVLHDAVSYASRLAAQRRIGITFGITTNGTLLREPELDLLRSYPFAVNVSLDGGKQEHDSLRLTRSGSGSFERAIRGVSPLLARPGMARVAARVTVTAKNLNVAAHIEALGQEGFSEIGVSPMRTGPNPHLRIAGDVWAALLEEMKSAADKDWARSCKTGGGLRFSNFSTALRQLYRGACNALPCGAAASYVSLSADGRYYTCHRTVGNQQFEMGDLEAGLSGERRRAFVASRAVDEQEPCRSCWARYLCGGGCHAEVAQAGREGCDSIRGWLEFCISIYPEVLAARPDLLRKGISAVGRKDEAGL